MILSMTAFSETSLTQGTVSASCEIRACNSKGLDISLRITSGYLCLEEKIKSMIAEKIARGRIDILVKIAETGTPEIVFEIDESRAKAYYNALNEIRNRFDIKSPVSLELMAGHNGIIKPSETEKDMDSAWTAVSQCVHESLCKIVGMRKQEGDFLAKDIDMRLETIEKQLSEIEKNSTDMVDIYQARLIRRIQQLTKGIADLDPLRITQEAAFLADRSDISEEIVRARSHIVQFRKIMDSIEPAGRKLNFLIQEMNREFNTIGSKTENASVSYNVVEVKAELEKIREQIQNIE